MQKYPASYRTTFHLALMVCYSILAVFSSCDSKSTKKDLDTSAVKLNYSSVRFDKLFFAMNPDSAMQDLNKLGTQYPDFTNLYLTRLAAFGEIGTPQFDTALHIFLTNKDYRALWDTVKEHFPNTDAIDKELKQTLTNIKYYYPNEPLGRVYYFVSGLNLWSAITLDSAVGVGLDMYLGNNFPFYATVNIPEYETRNRRPDRISIEVARAVYAAQFPFEYEGKTLLDMMLFKGRELYFTEQVCRDKRDDAIIGYSPEQIEWCKENEQMIYYFFVSGKLFYSTTWQEIMPYINDGPNTPGMPTESPGNIGTWLGWQIVRKYMQEHPNCSLQELMKLKMPAQQFLQDAKYKP